MMKREEALQKEKRKQPDSGPRERSRATAFDGFGQHVKERRAEHRAGRKAEVSLEPCVREDRRKRECAAEKARPDNGRAKEGERETHGRAAPFGPRYDCGTCSAIRREELRKRESA